MVDLDKKRYEKTNPNALACFLPQRIYPDVSKIELRKIAFHTLENNVTVTETKLENISFDCISPLIFPDSKILDSRRNLYKRDKRIGEIICVEEIKLDISYDQTLKEEERLAIRNQIIEHVADEDGTQQLLRFIKSIPKIKFRLTEE